MYEHPWTLYNWSCLLNYTIFLLKIHSTRYKLYLFYLETLSAMLLRAAASNFFLHLWNIEIFNTNPCFFLGCYYWPRNIDLWFKVRISEANTESVFFLHSGYCLNITGRFYNWISNKFQLRITHYYIFFTQIWIGKGY